MSTLAFSKRVNAYRDAQQEGLHIKLEHLSGARSVGGDHESVGEAHVSKRASSPAFRIDIEVFSSTNVSVRPLNLSVQDQHSTLAFKLAVSLTPYAVDLASNYETVIAQLGLDDVAPLDVSVHISAPSYGVAVCALRDARFGGRAPRFEGVSIVRHLALFGGKVSSVQTWMVR